jgi:hypothetical protein
MSDGWGGVLRRGRRWGPGDSRARSIGLPDSSQAAAQAAMSEGWWWALRGGRRCGPADSRTRNDGTTGNTLVQQPNTTKYEGLTAPISCHTPTYIHDTRTRTAGRPLKQL